MHNQVVTKPNGIETKGRKGIFADSTLDLIRRIVEKSDIMALEVLFGTRKLFRLKDRPSLSLPEYLSILRNRIAPAHERDKDERKLTYEYDKDMCEFADCAYDLTLAKYSNIPENIENVDRCPAKFGNVDCRYYYRAFLRKMYRRIDQGKITSQIQEEFEVGKILQNLVYKNFLRSKHECGRNNPLSKRYTWEVRGNNIYLWYPSYLTANEFRHWLEKQADTFDPNNPYEKERLQELVEKELGKGKLISLDDPDDYKKLSREVNSPAEDSWEGYQFAENLGKAVAVRKVKNIHRLRPGIQKIGKQRVEKMILQIFKDLSNDEYELSKIAAQYNISKATLSRFAGSKWSEKIEEEETLEIPDLWRNTVKILTKNTAFMEMVAASGFAGKLKKTLGIIKTREDTKNDG